MKWGGGGRSWFSNEAMAIDSNAGLIDVPLAQTGEGIAECELLKWFVKEVSWFLRSKIHSFFLDCSVSFSYESAILVFCFLQGDPIEEFQPLCEVQSDKATIEITSRFKGKVALISHSPGDIIKVRAYNMRKKKSILFLSFWYVFRFIDLMVLETKMRHFYKYLYAAKSIDARLERLWLGLQLKTRKMLF